MKELDICVSSIDTSQKQRYSCHYVKDEHVSKGSTLGVKLNEEFP